MTVNDGFATDIATLHDVVDSDDVLNVDIPAVTNAFPSPGNHGCHGHSVDVPVNWLPLLSPWDNPFEEGNTSVIIAGAPNVGRFTGDEPTIKTTEHDAS